MNIKAVLHSAPKQDFTLLESFDREVVERILRFHKSFPEYTPTPLAELKELARSLGVASIHVKDESYRFGLNAFKVLGGSYCMGRYIADRLELENVDYTVLTDPALREKLGAVHFVTATDGNHGRGIAWMANRIGQDCTVYMPKGSAAERLENIRALGADASIIEGNYDDAVRLAWQKQQTEGWVMVQDTAWPGYETIPRHIMQGYTTMAWEAAQQLGDTVPTHIFLQAGVGAMAGAVAACLCARFRHNMPTIVVVEPHAADCYYRTAQANDGKIHIVDGDMNTIMAGLACGEPCTLGWQILKEYTDCFVSIPDEAAAHGMRLLARPVGEDPTVISGESGAAALGCAAQILAENGFLKKALGLDEHARILFFSTEGDTDRENYQRILNP